jgi:Protein of unknown function (DUF2877)
MAARALFAGPGALRALGRRGLGAVELVLARGCYVRLEDDWLLVARPETPFGPLSLAVVGLDQRAIHPGQPARVESGRLLVGDHAVSLERMRKRRSGVDARPDRTGERCSAPAAERSEAATAALQIVGPPPASLEPGLAALRQGRIDEGVRLLAGLGEGLTPAGDDALAGYAAWRHSTGAPARLSAAADGGSSTLGLAYIRCAERGELPDAGAMLLAALRGGDPQAATAAARGLQGWGASSGAAIAWGIATGAAAQREHVGVGQPTHFAGVQP